MNNKPKVTIGMPVYNGEKFLFNSLKSLISQSYSNFEILISDNASTDRTGQICKELARKDNRIKYFRQTENIGPWRNFKFLLDKAETEYFMWSAADDIRSENFIELNYDFLSVNPGYVASTCANKFQDQNSNISFALDDDHALNRFIKFFKYCWFSHSIFYSLIRTNTLKKCTLMKEADAFFGIDWGVDIFLASKGKINLSEKGFTFYGSEGASKKSNHHKLVRSMKIELVIPFYKLSLYVIKITNNLNFINRLRIFFILLRLNVEVLYGRLRATTKNIFIFLKIMSR